MGDLRFVYPLALLLFILIPFLIGVIVYGERQRQKSLSQLGDRVFVEQLVEQLSLGRRWWKHALLSLSVMFLIIALSRPTWGIRTDLVETQGASVFILIDVSDSMSATDILPSRLERAKLSVRDLMQGIEGNEVGLIAFAGASFVVFPLTTDVQSAQTFLDYVGTDIISQQGTSVGAAIDLALQSFNESNATSKIIVLLSDGEEHSDEAEQSISAARDAGIVIHAVGYGTLEGSSIPIRDGAGRVVGNKQDRSGNIVITRLNEDLLKFVAARTDGMYQRLDGSERVVQNLIQLINNAQGSLLGEDEKVRGIERFGWFIALTLVFLSLEMLLPETKG